MYLLKLLLKSFMLSVYILAPVLLLLIGLSISHPKLRVWVDGLSITVCNLCGIAALLILLTIIYTIMI